MATAATKMVKIEENNTSQIEKRALEVFSDQEKANRWMSELNRALANRRPIDLVNTEIGFEEVNDVLTRIASGTYS